jgi:hypothetical protein
LDGGFINKFLFSLFVVMAPKVGNEWKDHDWWIKVDDSQKALLWITSHPVLEFNAPTATEAAVAPGAEAPTLSMLACTTATVGTNSSSLSFGWTMVDRVYTERVDGYYYDPEGVRYRRSGQEGQYSYE